MTNFEKKIKTIAMVLYLDYVAVSDEATEWDAIRKYESKAEMKIDVFKEGAIYKVPLKDGQDRMRVKHLIDMCKAEELQRVFVIKNTPIDWWADISASTEQVEKNKAEQTDPKKVYHIQDERIQIPEKFGNVDKTLHYLVANIGPNVDVVHLDMSTEHVQGYSVTEEYFKPIVHREYDQEEADWAIALGVSRECAAEYLTFYKAMYPPTWEHHMYLTANGGSEPGSTPDAQVVKCPVCGRPTWAAPASVGSKDNYDGGYKPLRVDSKQMTCEHCKADLSPCFNKVVF